jgi:hypothetical protein
MALPERPRETSTVATKVVVGGLALIGLFALLNFLFHLLFGLITLAVVLLVLGAIIRFALRSR